MKHWFNAALVMICFLLYFTHAEAVGDTPILRSQEMASTITEPAIDNHEGPGTEITRYRSGRRSYRPAPGYQAPVRATPPARYNTPRRTGGFLGGLGGFMAGAFLGSMFFGPLFGGMGHFTFLGLFIDLILLFLLILFVRRIWTRGRERH